MTIRSDSYSTVDEVTAYTRHLLDGQSAYNSTTRPTLNDVETMINRVSGVLNVSLAKAGYNASAVLANSTAKIACDEWVTMKVVEHVELTQRGTGYSDAEGSRVAAFRSLYKGADEFVSMTGSAFANLGVTQTIKKSAGLAFTGLTAQPDRADPDNDALEQPLFTRRKFDDPALGGEDDQ